MARRGHTAVNTLVAWAAIASSGIAGIAIGVGIGLHLLSVKIKSIALYGPAEGAENPRANQDPQHHCNERPKPLEDLRHPLASQGVVQLRDVRRHNDHLRTNNT